MIGLTEMAQIMTTVALWCGDPGAYRNEDSEPMKCRNAAMICTTDESNSVHGLTAKSLVKCLGPKQKTEKK